MSKTETQSEALSAERRLFITAVANLELRKKFGDEGFKLDLERDELEALIEMAERVGRLDAEVRELKMTVQHESLCVEAAKERIEALDAENKALRAQLEQESAIRQHGWSIHYADERDFCLAASPLIGAAYVCGADAVKRLNNSPWGLRHFGVVRATGPAQTDTPQAAAKTGDAA